MLQPVKLLSNCFRVKWLNSFSTPPAQVPESCVQHAPQGDRQAAELGGEGRPGGGDPHCRLQRLQGRHRAGGILVARRRDGKFLRQPTGSPFL